MYSEACIVFVVPWGMEYAFRFWYLEMENNKCKANLGDYCCLCHDIGQSFMYGWLDMSDLHFAESE